MFLIFSAEMLMNTPKARINSDPLPPSADVVVIGGGTVGTAVAYYLAKEGMDVVLLERGALGSEAPGANAGFTWVHTKNPGMALDLSIAGVDMYETLSEELDFDIQFLRCGGFADIPDYLDVILAKKTETSLVLPKGASIDMTWLQTDKKANVF